MCYLNIRFALLRTGEIMAQKPTINNFESVLKTIDGRKQELLGELQLVKRTHVRLQQRLDFIRQMTDRCLLTGQESIPTALLDAMLNANSSEQARRIVQQLQTGEGTVHYASFYFQMLPGCIITVTVFRLQMVMNG
jgi:hypothetical protein